jgi:hypothetical protein
MTHDMKRNAKSILGLAVFVVLAFGSTDQNQNGSSSSQNSGSTQESPKEIALRTASLDFKWSKQGFGNVMIADFTIQNPSTYPIKDIEITCSHFGKSGTEIDSNTRTIYDVVPAKGKKTIKNFNMGFIHTQAASSSCKIVDLVIAPG